MTGIKLCGLSRACDVEWANALLPDYIGFVFANGSRRYVDRETAESLSRMAAPSIKKVGVFVNESPDKVAALLLEGIIDLAQLHGDEDEDYITRLRDLTDRPLIQAFRIRKREDAVRAESSTADLILLDAGAGTGETFDWQLIKEVKRPYLLAGGLDETNVAEAMTELHPFGVDVSSGIEESGVKDKEKMAAFVEAVRKEDENVGQ